MIFYIYLGYPLLIALIGLIRKKASKKGPFEPSVTILLAAYNEQDVIEATLKNKLDLDYPKEKLEIIVISDGSWDRTDEIIRRYEGEKVYRKWEVGMRKLQVQPVVGLKEWDYAAASMRKWENL